MSLDRFKCKLVTITHDETVEAAARLMRDRSVGSLIIAREGRPVAIVTDRDLVVRVMSEGRDPTRSRVGEFATYDPITVNVGEGIETAIFRMRHHGVRRLPVVDEQGIGVGIVTADDLLVLLGGEISGICEGIETPSDALDSK